MQKILIDDTYASRDARQYKDVSPTLRSERFGFKVMERRDAQPLKRRRTEEERRRRHLHGDNGATFSKGKESYIGNDGIANTVTTVFSKDNIIAEIMESFKIQKIEYVGHIAPEGSSGTGYSQYDDVKVIFSDDYNVIVRLGTWYTPHAEIFRQLLKTLNQLPTEEDSPNVCRMLFAALATYDPHNFQKCELTDDEVRSIWKDTYEKRAKSVAKYTENGKYRIRKLTPRECFRLMDVCESDIDKIQASGVSESQQYRMAGNSIVVSCMVGIFKNLYCEESEPQNGQLTLF